MKNPWTVLPSTPPFELACDTSRLSQLDRQFAGRDRFMLRRDLMPEPYFGNPHGARVVLLMSNPGADDRDADVHADPAFRALARSSLLHDLEPDAPFLHLRKEGTHPGAEYWRRHVREVINALTLEVVASRIFVAQLCPYHSKNYHDAHSQSFMSQHYTDELVVAAARRGALLIILRGLNPWREKLGSYADRALVGRSALAATVSTKNLPVGGFDRVLDALGD